MINFLKNEKKCSKTLFSINEGKFEVNIMKIVEIKDVESSPNPHGVMHIKYRIIKMLN